MGTFDEHARAVLSVADGRAAPLVRAFLTGLRAGLDDLPTGEPGRDDAEALAAVIGDLLDVRSRTANADPVAEGTAVASPTTDALRAELLSLRETVARRVGEASIGEPADDLARVWATLHLSALRLPRDEAEAVRQEAEDLARQRGSTVAEASPTATSTATTTVHGVRDEVLVPELWLDRRVQAPGLALSPRGKLLRELPRPAAAEEVVRPLFALAGQILVLIEQDPRLHHCLQVIEFSGLRSLAATAERREFAEHLNRRSRAVTEAVPFTGPWLDALVRLHEALCSVVHLPPAPDDTWWGERRLTCNEALAAGADLTPGGSVKFPPARYAAAAGLTRQDISLQLPRRSGQVLVCVKAWSRVDGDVNPGRVIYAS
ncbi:hypothetical protein [Sphaerimonospora thailandensis]|uniref:Uncharacterized protein n=1 Tax=Sphaerimonospora thailandensis TaxID=795644 RepID=A0A8J3REZ7_9ACTN|nr:hypothetical protein [Sphaerimonospora thailandensis]GIH72504.1 hypothetical protein Mth01_47570 [Sphaerimonospora thailandensis]